MNITHLIREWDGTLSPVHLKYGPSNPDPKQWDCWITYQDGHCHKISVAYFNSIVVPENPSGLPR